MMRSLTRQWSLLWIAAFLSLLLLPLSAGAQQRRHPDPVYSLEALKETIGPEMLALRYLVGDWKGTGTYEGSPIQADVHVEWMTIEGHPTAYLRQVSKINTVSYCEEAIYSWDTSEQMYRVVDLSSSRNARIEVYQGQLQNTTLELPSLTWTPAEGGGRWCYKLALEVPQSGTTDAIATTVKVLKVPGQEPCPTDPGLNWEYFLDLTLKRSPVPLNVCK